MPIYKISKQQTIDKNINTDYFSFASRAAELVTFIFKNLLSKDAIVSFVTDRELYLT